MCDEIYNFLSLAKPRDLSETLKTLFNKYKHEKYTKNNKQIIILDKNVSRKYNSLENYRDNINMLAKILNVLLSINFDHIKTVNNFDKSSNVNELTICKCIRTNIIKLESLRTLRLDHCSITNIHDLQSLVKLNLNNVRYIKNINMLQNLEELIIINCKKIKDICGLRKLKILVTNDYIYGIESLKNLEKIQQKIKKY